MINHARTLLLNTTQEQAGSLTLPGAEYVPPDFIPVRVSPELRLLRSTLFGSDPDSHYANYRLGQYMSLLHSTELAERVLTFDPRITYRLDRPDERCLRDAYLPQILQVAGEDRPETLVGAVDADDARGKSHYSWTVKSTIFIVTVTQLRPDSVSETVNPDVLAPIVLPGSGLLVYLKDRNNATWTVNAVARPGRSLGKVFAVTQRLLASQSRRQALFGSPAPAVCGELYDRHFALPYRLGAVLLAMIYQLDAARQGST